MSVYLELVHRKKSYPHIHVPLKALHSRSMRRRVTSPHISESEPSEQLCSPEEASRLTDSDTGHLSTATAEEPADEEDEEEEDTGALSSESDPPLSDPANQQQQQQQFLESPVSGSPDKRVQFTIGQIQNIPEDEAPSIIVEPPESDNGKDKKHRKK